VPGEATDASRSNNAALVAINTRSFRMIPLFPCRVSARAQPDSAFSATNQPRERSRTVRPERSLVHPLAPARVATGYHTPNAISTPAQAGPGRLHYRDGRAGSLLPNTLYHIRDASRVAN